MQSGVKVHDESLPQVQFRVKTNNLLKKILVVCLLTLFAGDNLALWDLLEHFGLGFHEVTIENGTQAEVHHHDDDATEHQRQPVDTCTFCPCCVYSLNMLTSDFTFPIELSILGIVDFPTCIITAWSEYGIYHPPTLS
jgi:hypothetical protein